jgi:hypothetical protein
MAIQNEEDKAGGVGELEGTELVQSLMSVFVGAMGKRADPFAELPDGSKAFKQTVVIKYDGSDQKPDASRLSRIKASLKMIA